VYKQDGFYLSNHFFRMGFNSIDELIAPYRIIDSTSNFPKIPPRKYLWLSKFFKMIDFKLIKWFVYDWCYDKMNIGKVALHGNINLTVSKYPKLIMWDFAELKSLKTLSNKYGKELNGKN